MIHYERCGCNAAILAWSKIALKDWRENHRHDCQHEEQSSIEESYTISPSAWVLMCRWASRRSPMVAGTYTPER